MRYYSVEQRQLHPPCIQMILRAAIMKMPKFFFLACWATVLLAQQSVEITTVAVKPVERQVHLPGEFLPYLQVDIYARVPAFVDQINVDRGSQVQEGDLLAMLNAPEMSGQVAEAEA